MRRELLLFCREPVSQTHHSNGPTKRKTILRISYLMTKVSSFRTTRCRCTIWLFSKIWRNWPTCLKTVTSVPEFCGKAQELVTAWLQKFSLVARANDQTDAKKAKKIPMYLKGFPQTFYLSKLNKQNGCAWAKDWSSFEQNLKDRFLLNISRTIVDNRRKS